MATECEGIARVDCFVRDNGDVLVNELNTMPGFTATSVYAKLFAAYGRLRTLFRCALILWILTLVLTPILVYLSAPPDLDLVEVLNTLQSVGLLASLAGLFFVHQRMRALWR